MSTEAHCLIMCSEVNNVINHQLTKTVKKKFFCTNSTPESQVLPEVRQVLANEVPVEVRGWLKSEEDQLASQAEPHHMALTGGVFVFQSLSLSYLGLVASRIQQD